MKLLRHLLALAILAGFGYAYYQQQTAPRPTPQAERFDPFAGWKETAQEAPAFSANRAQTSPAEAADSSSENRETPPTATPAAPEVPRPIPFSVAGLDSVDADPASWADSLKARAQALQSGSTRESQPERPATIQRESAATDEKSSNNSKPAQKPADPFVEYAPNAADKPPAHRGNAPRQSAYRQLTLGVGSRKTVCVLDHSATEDGLLLSTLIAGLRREWTSDIERNREKSLVLLMGDHTVSRTSEETARELADVVRHLGPERLVHVHRGQDHRGWLRFSSDEESIAALMAVPGAYRIKADPALRLSPTRGQQATVRLELPENLTTREQSTVQLLQATLLGNWSDQLQLAHSGQGIASLPPAAQPQQKSLGETTSSFFRNLYENTLGGSSSREPAGKTDPPQVESHSRGPQPQVNSGASAFGRDVPQQAIPQPRYVPRPTSGVVAIPESRATPRVELLPSPPELHSRASPPAGNSSGFYKLPPAPKSH